MRFALLSRTLSGADHPCLLRRRPVLNSRNPGDLWSEPPWLPGGMAISTISPPVLVFPPIFRLR